MPGYCIRLKQSTSKIKRTKTGEVDNYLVVFSMKITRDGALNYVITMALLNKTEWLTTIKARDLNMAKNSKFITQQNKWIQFLLWTISLGERGSFSDEMNELKAVDRAS